MKITVIPAAGGRQRISEFADNHGLEMVVRERSEPWHPGARWYARFDRSDVKEGGFIVGVFGDGPDPTNAIKAYAERIGGQLLVIDSGTALRREIKVPALFYDPEPGKE